MRRALFLLALPLAPGLFAQAALAQTHAVGRSVMPDPPPLTEKTQWVFDLRWDSGSVYLVTVRKIEMPQPMTTPRAMGRFAIELTDHGVLVERARFDFPGMAVPDEDGGIRMTDHLRTRIGVFFPATSRGDKLELVDRTTGQRWALPWPPESGSPDAGKLDGG
jgi:hypothetical protein